MYDETYKKLLKQAQKLVMKLQDDIDTGKKEIYEDYGQREVRNFIDNKIDSLKSGVLSYSEECNIKEVLYQVSNIH